MRASRLVLVRGLIVELSRYLGLIRWICYGLERGRAEVVCSRSGWNHRAFGLEPPNLPVVLNKSWGIIYIFYQDGTIEAFGLDPPNPLVVLNEGWDNMFSIKMMPTLPVVVCWSSVFSAKGKIIGAFGLISMSRSYLAVSLSLSLSNSWLLNTLFHWLSAWS